MIRRKFIRKPKFTFGTKQPKKRQPKTAFEILQDKLDKVFSKFIRLRDAHEWVTQHPNAAFGYVACCTCGGVHHWKEMDAGHFVGRTSHNTRWEESNVHAQCGGCNKNEGKKPEYTLFLQEKYGPQIIQQLVIAGKRPKHWAHIELEALIAHYQGEVERMQEAMNEVQP